MKKYLAIALVVVLAVSLLAACSGGGFEGTYKLTKATAAGVSVLDTIDNDMSFTFKSDGTGDASMVEDGKHIDAPFTWTREDDKVSVKVDGDEIVFSYANKQLSIELNGITMVFEKQ